MNLLGISAFYHDSAAALLVDGKIASAAQEERFTRKKHDASFPKEAVKYCLESQKLKLSDIHSITFYDKPFLTFERLLETYLSYSPFGIRSFMKAMPVWLREKLDARGEIRRQMADIFQCKKKDVPPIYFTYHHQSHAASAFFPSPFSEAAILCIDGVGEWATTSAWHGSGSELTPLWEMRFPHSLGLLYSAFTGYCGFKVNSGEYKLMGLAPYGEPIYYDLIKEHLIDIKEDGSFRLNLKYFDFMVGLRMTNSHFHELFGREPRHSESELEKFHCDVAASIQKVTEEVVIKLAKTLRQETGLKYLCLAGGVALNCVANGKLAEQEIFEKIWIQPAAGDAGGALGAALTTWYDKLARPRNVEIQDQMAGSYLGPSYSDQEVEQELRRLGARYTRLSDEDLVRKTAQNISEGKVVGWFQGRMEYGPRALGARSFLGDPRHPEMQKKMNLKIKYRESFRPFAPSVLHEKVPELFTYDHNSPYMLLVSHIKEPLRQASAVDSGFERLNEVRSPIPAVTHVDYSARLQTVSKDSNGLYYSLLKEFDQLTGVPVVINTSFNVRGEPIVCTPEDAFRCFMSTEADVLVVGNFLLEKNQQNADLQQKQWELD